MKRKKLFLTINILIIFGLLYLPYLGMTLKVANTMIHETGHAIMALLMKGEVYSISLFSNTEGIAKTASYSWMGMFLTSVFGYVFSSLIALLLAILYQKNKHKIIVNLFLIVSVVNLIMWVRNLYGIVWLISFSLIVVLLLKKNKEKQIKILSFILTIILICSSFKSCLDIMLLSYHNPSVAGDATNLNNITLLPTIVWGTVFFIQGTFFSTLATFKLYKKAK